MTVTPTRDYEFLRRWMLRPAFVRKMGGFPKGVDPNAAFDTMYNSDAHFFGVWCGKEEKGCIIFSPIFGGWELHLCLATWWTKTRTALRIAMEAMRETRKPIAAAYAADRKSIDLLLDDVGFPVGYVHDGKRIREFTF